MASTLYENVEDWRSSEESRNLLSSGEREPLSFKGDVEDHDDGFEEICPKQQQLTEMTEKELHGENENTKENGHDYNGINGNGVHEELEEDEGNDNDEGEDGGEGDGNDEVAEDQHKEEEGDGSLAAETYKEGTTPAVPFYGRTLVAPEYMNFQPPEETPRTEERSTAEDDANKIAAMEELHVQVDENHEEEETSSQTVVKEVLEEDDLISSEEESDDNGNYDVKDEGEGDYCLLKEEEQEEEDEEGGKELEEKVEEEEGEQKEEDEAEGKELEEKVEEEEEEEEEKGEEEERVEQYGEGEEEKEDPGDGSKLTPVEVEGSPQLAQAEDDEEQSEIDEPEEEIEDNGIKEEEEEDDVEEVEPTLETENETCLQLANTDDEDSDHYEEIGKEYRESASKSTRRHSDSLKVHIHSPTPDNVSSATQSFDDEEVVTTEDDDGNQVIQEESAQELSPIETDEDEEQRDLFNGPVETHESHQNKDGEGRETVDGESFQGDDSEEDRDGGDETVSAVCESGQEGDGGVDVDIPRFEGKVEETDTSRESPYKDEYAVHFSFQGQDKESDLTGRVKELGRMFDGGGPVFPAAGKNNTEAVDGSPVSVRRYKAIFEQDRLSTERARDPGRREELANPPRGIVKNLRGLFENPQGFEARKG